MSTEVLPALDTGSIDAFASGANYEAARRMAEDLASSTLVPEQYRGSVANCLIALDLAAKTRTSVSMVMQNFRLIDGEPAWSATFLIGTVNACGRFTPIAYEFEGEEAKAGWKCRAYATDLATGVRLDGEWITWEMVVGEGWLTQPGSKWKTMPGQMIRYRAASFWTRTFAPDVSLGMHTADEVEDFTAPSGPSLGTRELNAALNGTEADGVEVRPSVNVADIPCPICSAAPWKEHKPECEHA